jgi:hypothetical protein
MSGPYIAAIVEPRHASPSFALVPKSPVARGLSGIQTLDQLRMFGCAAKAMFGHSTPHLFLDQLEKRTRCGRQVLVRSMLDHAARIDDVDSVHILNSTQPMCHNDARGL